MRSKKIRTALLAAGIASAMIFTGCGSTGSGNLISVSESTISGTVSSIDGDTIMLSVDGKTAGKMGGGMMQSEASQGAAGQSDNQTPPEKPDESETGNQSNTDTNNQSDTNTNNQADNQTPPEKPDGESNGNDASSEASSDSNGAPSEAGNDSNDASSEASSNSNGAPSEAGSDSNGASSEAGSDSADDQKTDSTDSDGTLTFELVLKDTSVLKDSDDNSIETSDIEEGDALSVTIDENGDITSVVLEDENGDSQAVSYSAVKEFTQDDEVTDETYDSTGTDENAVLVSNGAEVTLNNITSTRKSSDSTGGDNSSFYGVGADVLAADGTAYVNGGNFTTDANGGAGLFAYNKGVIYASDATINTSADISGGIHAAGGGTLYAWDLNVTTAGNSSAAIRSDRGGGTIVADGGSYTSTGTGSPAVYTTADITVNDAALTAKNSEAVCLEGKNTLRLYDCDLSGNMSDDDQNDCTWNVILYQSMSGDSEEGEGTFQMVGGSLTAKNGGQFYTTNTQSTFYLSGVDITNAKDSEFFLRCTGNNNQRGWGNSGSNGADCNFTASDQAMEGDVIYDSISNLDFYITDESSLTGAFIDDESYAGSGGNGEANLYIDADSTWIVTGDSTLTNLQCEGTITDANGKTVTIKGTDGTVYVQGSSNYTVTVESYSKTADVSGAATADSYSTYAVDKPEQLS